MASGYQVVLVTAPPKKAAALAKGLVGAKLAACVNVIPSLTSHYRWEGKVQKDRESLLVIKTRASLLKRVEKWVKANHPYTVPEVISLPVTGGSRDYLAWLRKSTAR
jgi:periplasmic divalent cation tolerance protein